MPGMRCQRAFKGVGSDHSKGQTRGEILDADLSVLADIASLDEDRAVIRREVFLVQVRVCPFVDVALLVHVVPCWYRPDILRVMVSEE